MQSAALCPLTCAGAVFYPIPTAYLRDCFICFTFSYQKARFTAPPRLAKSPCRVPSRLASWRTKVSHSLSSWACCFLTFETSVGTSGTFESRSIWGTGICVGSLSWPSTDPSKSLWLFLKCSSAFFGARHASLTPYTQPGFHVSACLSLVLCTSLLLFHLFEANFSLIVHFGIAWLLSSTFGGWFI